MLPICSFARSASRRFALVCLLAAAGGSAVAGPALPEALRPVLERALDNPHDALSLADATLDSLDSEARFWRLLGKAAAYTLLDQSSAAKRAAKEKDEEAKRLADEKKADEEARKAEELRKADEAKKTPEEIRDGGAVAPIGVGSTGTPGGSGTVVDAEPSGVTSNVPTPIGVLPAMIHS